MSIESFTPSEKLVKSTTLTEKQKRVVDAVLEALENPETNAKVTIEFKKMFTWVAGNHEKFNALMENAGAHEKVALAGIEKQFQSWEIGNIRAKELAQETVKHFTQIELLALKQQYQLAHAA